MRCCCKKRRGADSSVKNPTVSVCRIRYSKPTAHISSKKVLREISGRNSIKSHIRLKKVLQITAFFMDGYEAV